MARVEEDPPLFQRGVENRVEFVVAMDRDEAPSGVGVPERLGQVRRVYILVDPMADPPLDETLRRDKAEVCALSGRVRSFRHRIDVA